MAEQQWPQQLWIVRHGQSAGNVARDVAEAAAHHWVNVSTRDVDTPLSALGEQQSMALGHWFSGMPADARPTAVLTSPFLRARQTTSLLLDSAGIDPEAIMFRADERLREKEFGILDRLTKVGVQEKYPLLNDQRSQVGKFYFRPPGGESWCDVILRLRSIVDTLTRDYQQERVLIVAHQVIVNCFRYLLERLDEAQILMIDRAADVPNCAVTSYEFDTTLGRGKLALRLVNFIAPLREAGTPVTAEPDRPAQKDAGA